MTDEGGEGLMMEDPSPLGHYLGCLHVQGKVTLPNGNVANTVTYDMEEFLGSCVKRYIDLATEVQGTEPKLRVVGTPFLDDSAGSNVAGSPCASDGTPSVFCPWCNNHFPVAGNTSDPIAALREADRKKAKQKKAAEEAAKQNGNANVGGDGSADGTSEAENSYLRMDKPLEADAPDRGVLQPLAAKVLMTILYAARMARFDLLRSIIVRACLVTCLTLD